LLGGLVPQAHWRAPQITRRRIAWILILIVDVGYIAWGAGAAIAPDHLLGPGGRAILPAGYEGYAGGAWSALDASSAGYMSLLYRLYGTYCVLFGFMGSAIAVTAFRRGERWAQWTLLAASTVALVSAIAYGKTVNAIGPFELTEYLGLLMVWGAFAITAPFRADAQPVPATGLRRSCSRRRCLLSWRAISRGGTAS
jgi:hypothetical protein